MTAARASDRAALIEELERTSGRAAESSGGFVDRYFDLAGLALRLRFTGEELISAMVPALAHLATDPVDDPALTIRIWDSDSTSTPGPVPPWGPDAYLQHGTVRGYFEDGVYTVFNWVPKTLSVLDADGDNGYFWIESAGRLGMNERSAPLRVLLHLWLSEHGVQLAHAAGIGQPQGCLLLVGNSGSGKTSTALSCLGSELRHLGEDYCLVRAGTPPMVSSLYNTAKVDLPTLDRLPGLRELLVSMPTADFPKALLDLRRAKPQKLLATAPLRAIVIPAISDQPQTQARPATAGAALAALAPSTLLQLPGTGEAAMKRLSAVVRSVPCHHLSVGSDPSRIPAAIDSLLAGE